MLKSLRVLASLGLLAACSGGETTGPSGNPVPTQLSLGTAPATAAQNGVALAIQPSVRLRDAAGIPVALAGVTVTVSSTTAGVSLAGASATTDNSGIATFSGLTLTGTVGSYVLRFSSTNLAAVDAAAIVLWAGVPAALAVTVEPSPLAQAGVVLAAQPRIQLRDASSNSAAQAGITVTASVISGTATVSSASVTTDATGLAAFTGLTISGATGIYTLRFSASGLTAANAGTPTTVAAGPPTQVALITSPSSSSVNAAVFATQATTQLRDAFGNNAGQAGVPVVATLVSSPAGTIAGDSALTNAGGLATFAGMRITGVAGAYSVRFAAPGLSSIVAPVTITAGAATRIGLTTQPSLSAQNGAVLAVQPVVQVQDQSGNAVAQAGVVVRATLSTGGAALAGDSALSDATGRAVFAGMAITGTAGAYTIQFAAAGFTGTSATNSTFVSAGAATRLVALTQPAVTAQNAVVLTRQPAIRLQDASNNNVSQANVVVTASLVSGSLTLDSASATTNGTGVATFSGLKLTGLVGSYTLRFSSAGLTAVDASAPTVLSAGVAAQLGLTTQPSATATSGAQLAAQPVVQLRDVSGNAVAQAGLQVNATIVGGGPTLANATATTVAAGSATFAGLTVSGLVGGYTLRFSSGTLVPVDAAAPLMLGPGAPAALVIVTGPPASATNGVALSPAPVVEVRDAAGNPVPGIPVDAGASGNVTLTGRPVTTLADGRATFAGLTLTGIATGYSIRFCLPSCTVVSIVVGSSVPTHLDAGAPAQVTITTPPSSAAQSGIVLPVQPQVLIEDVSGNLVAGATVTATVAGAAVTGGSAITGSDGVATFSGLTISGAPAGYTLTFASGAASTGSPVTLDVGPAASLTITTAPSNTATNGLVLATQPVLLVRDATGNPVPDATVTVTTGAGATVSNGSAVSNAGGVATFTGLGLSGAAGAYTLDFASGTGLASAGVTLNPGPATAITVTTQPGTNAQNGIALGPQPVVRITDGSANGVPGAIVTASVIGGGATVSYATATTNASGDALFAGLTLSGTIGNYTLRFLAAGVGSLQVDAAAPTALSAGNAARLIVQAQPSATAPSGAALVAQPAIQVTDVGGNPILAAGTQVTATLAATAGTLLNATATTNGSGLATFSGLAISALAGNHALRFGSPGLQSADAAAPTAITPGAANRLTVTRQPSNSSVLGQPLQVQPIIQVRDAAGNAVSQAGTAVTASVVSGAPVLSDVSATTDAQGAATFNALTIESPAGRYRLRFTATGLAQAVAADSTVAGTLISSGVPVTNLSGAALSAQTYAILVLPGDTLLTVHIEGFGSLGEDADLYVRSAQVSDIGGAVHDCFPNLPGSEETCQFPNPQPGLWYISIYGFFSYSNLTLTATRLP